MADQTDPDHRNVIRHYWEVMWDWLGQPVVRQRSVYLLIIIFMFYLPLPYFGRVVQDWFWDRGLFFDPKHEGAIIVESPQLFTRERLINQRLDDSRWIDGRIEAVDKMIAENRFGLPDEVREDFLKLRLALGGPASETDTDDQTVTKTAQDDDTKGPVNINVGPHLEFADAHEYRQFLVQTKYEYVLDDIHDTHSNTLHRLNFNLFVSPSRSYSSSIAAVSVRLQQPTDPQWLLHKYGALLLDIREELSDTAKKLIQDRHATLFQSSINAFPADVDRLLRREISALTQSTQEPLKLIDDAHELLLIDATTKVNDDIKRRVREMAPGTEIGQILFNFFAAPQIRLVQDTGPNQPDVSAPVLTGSGGKRTGQAGDRTTQRTNRQPQEHPLLMAVDRLFLKCGQHIDLLNLLPPSFFRGSQTYKALTTEMRAKWDVLFPEFDTAPDGPDVDLQLRQILHNLPLTAPCLDPRRTGNEALLSVLGYLALNKTGMLPKDTEICFPRGNQSVRDYFQRAPGAIREQLTRWCPGLRQSLIRVGVVHLVKAELENTPVDTVGRVKDLKDYFHLDTKGCDVRNCQITVLTKAEQQREQLALGLIEYIRTQNPSEDDLRKEELFQKHLVQRTGNNEALRLFAELACFSNARSYTVYPRKGAGRNVQHTQTEQRTLWSLFGGSSVSVSDGGRTTERERRNTIFGIGDTGDEPRDKDLECGPSFLRVLNTLEPTDDVVKVLTESLNANTGGFDPRWTATLKCLLHIETKAPKNPGKAREACHSDVPTPHDAAPEFDIYHLTSVVRHLRQRETTVSWIVPPLDSDGRGKRHELNSQPLSALVSIPSWWPGVELVIETCWVRPRWIGNNTSKGLCQDTPDPKTGQLLTVFDRHIKDAKARGRIESSQILPLPHDLDDVLPKLGFFIVRYPYLDNFEANTVSLETGRKVQLRLTGKRLWKNPRVRLGEQWHDEVHVLPDMQGIVATFECLAPIRRPGRIMVDDRHLKTARNLGHDPADDMLFWAQTRADPRADELYTELRQVQVWTSEGATNPANLEVSSFRPVDRRDGENDQPCWPIGKPRSEDD